MRMLMCWLVMEGIKTAGTVIGDGFNSYISDTKAIGTTVAALSALALGVYAAKGGASVASQYISARLVKVGRSMLKSNELDQTNHPLSRRLFATHRARIRSCIPGRRFSA